MYMGGDMIAHLRYVKSIYVSMFVERAFPPFYSNDMGMALQPIFRYYSVVIYALSAVFSFLGFTAYKSLLIGTTVLYGLGAYGIFIILRYFRINQKASITGALVFLFAPYHFVVLYARGAYAEISALNIVPFLFYSLIRLNASHGKKYGVSTALWTAMLILSHKIFLSWFFILFGLFLILSKRNFHPIKVIKHHILPTILWVSLGMMAVASYWLPGYLAVKNLGISTVFCAVSLSNWKMLLSPLFAVSPDCNVPDLATQYGLPTVLGVIGSFFFIKKRKLMLAAAVTFLLLFIVEANVGNILNVLPKTLSVIQFPYRLLIFNSLFGSIAFGFALNELMRGERKKTILFAACFVTLGYASYYRHTPPLSAITEQVAEHMNLYMEAYKETTLTNAVERFRVSGVHIVEGTVLQNGTIFLDRYPGDEAKLYFEGVVPGEILDKNPTIEIYLDHQLWQKKDLGSRRLAVNDYLPPVKSKVQQQIKFKASSVYIPSKVYSYSVDNREVILMSPKMKISNRDIVYIKPDQLLLKGNRVELELDMKKDVQYILPILYSKYLILNDNEITMSSDKDGIIIKSSTAGFRHLLFQRIEFPLIDRISMIFSLLIVILGLLRLRIKYNSKDKIV